MKRVLIVDDDALIRDSLKMLLELEPDFKVAGLAANGQEAIDFCKQELPDLVLMDIRMPVLDGVLGTKRLKALYPQLPVVVLTTFRDEEYIKEAMRNGASGYILKSQPADSIIESLRAAAKGNIVLDRDVATSLSAMLPEASRTDLSRYSLTEREAEVLALVGQGLSNREIAGKLFLSEGTVRNYVTALLEKLDLRDRTQLAIFYVKNLE